MADKIPTFDWFSATGEAFSLFKQRLELYFKVKGIEGENQVPILLLAVGEEGLRRYNSWILSEADKTSPTVLFTKFLEQIQPSENYRLCRLKLHRYAQRPNESLDEFVNRCRLLARKCDFSKAETDDRILEQIIVSTPIQEFQRELLAKDKTFKLASAITLGRTHEAANAHLQELKNINSSAGAKCEVASIKEKSKSVCTRCNKSHAKDKCPAKDSVCNFCQKKGHWANCCFFKKSDRKLKEQKFDYKKSAYKHERKKFHAVERQEYDEQDSDCENFEALSFHTVSKPGKVRRVAHVKLDLKLPHRPGTHGLELKADTGAEGNTLPLRIFKQMFPEKVDKLTGLPKHNALRARSVILSAYNDKPITYYGDLELCIRYRSSEYRMTEFLVVDVQGPGVLGLESCELLGVVTMHCDVKLSVPPPINSVKDLQILYPEQFDKIGEFKTVCKLKVDKSVEPHVDAPRKVPIALKERIKAELDSMVEKSIIAPVEEPTEWVSSLVYVTKTDGSLRICLSPKHLNQALVRPHYKTPTIEEINHRFSGAKFFSKLDAKCGYWATKLHPESQKLTTFQTPFGRYCFLRLPFGLSVSQDVFQREMDRITGTCTGVCGIADDIVVFGTTEEEHDRNLRQFMEAAKSNGLSLNSTKCAIKQDSITFFGNVYSSEGVQPDAKKVRDLRNMPAPSSKAELHQFIGMMTYLSVFIHDFSRKCYVLRELLKENVPYQWEAHHEQAFEQLKCEVSENSMLAFYEPQRPLFLECDASLKGLGVSLVQPDENGRNRPIAFASKSLSPAEKNYACIERELLAIVFGVQRFHTYLCGRSFSVITDHKPLVMIARKPLTAVTPRLQRMLIKLQGYNFSLSYRPGKDEEHTLPDILSRLPCTDSLDEIDLDLRIDLIRFSTDKLQTLRLQTVSDPVLNQLAELIVMGWPETVKEVPTDLRQYWSIRDELSIIDGILLKGQQVIVRTNMQDDILAQLHAGHLGVEKTLLRAKDSVYWLNMKKDIEQAVKSCKACEENKPSQVNEPLLQPEIPSRPWAVLGTDLFQFDDHQWLIIADYYTKFPIVKKVPYPCPSARIVSITKEVFSEWGIPDKVISDNGPHYASVHYREFAKEWGFEHVTSSPRYPRSNGFIERQIQTVKSVMKKAKATQTDLEMALLCLRTTPVTSQIPSPVQLMTGRKVKSNLPIVLNNQKDEQIQSELKKRQDYQKFFHDKHARMEELPPLYAGQRVMVQDQDSKSWFPATITEKCQEPRSYLVQCPNGNILRRNRLHIRPTTARFNLTPIRPQAHLVKPPEIPQVVAERPKPDIPTVLQPCSKNASSENIHKTTRSGRAIMKPARYQDV